MKNTASISVTLILAGLLMTSGCASVDRDWTKATQQNTVAAYQQFMAKHPDSAGMATDKIRDLDWQVTRQSNTSTAYQTFCERYPDHSYAARQALDRINLEESWKSACDTNSSASYLNHLKAYPASPYRKDAQTKIAGVWKAEAATAFHVTKAVTSKEPIKMRTGLVMRGTGFEPSYKEIPPKAGSVFVTLDFDLGDFIMPIDYTLGDEDFILTDADGNHYQAMSLMVIGGSTQTFSNQLMSNNGILEFASTAKDTRITYKEGNKIGEQRLIEVPGNQVQWLKVLFLGKEYPLDKLDQKP